MLKVAWRSLLARKLRLLTSTAAIVLGVAFVVGTLVFTDTLNKSFVAVFDNSVGDVVVQPRGAEDAGGQETSMTVPASLVAKLAELPGAARADGNVVSLSVFVADRTKTKVIGGNGAPGLGLNHTDAPTAHGGRGLQVETGRAPRGPDDVALDEATARRGHYQVGDRVRLVNGGTRAALTPRLVGLVGYPGGGSLNGATATVWDTRTAQKLFLDARDSYSNIWVTARPGVSQDELRDQAARVLPKDVTAVTGDKAARDAASGLLDAIRFLTVFLLVFAGISLVVGSFLIVNTFSMLVAQRTRELALLRALGAGRGQVVGSVLFESVVVGLFGSTVGVGLGALLAVGIRAVFGRFGLDLSGQPLIYAPRTFLAAYAVGVLVTVIAAYLPARRTGRVPPIAALRDDVALPESSVRRRLWVGAVMILAGVAVGGVGVYAEVSRRGLWIGAAALLMLLGTTAAAPMIARPFLLGVRWLYERLFGTVGRLAGQNPLRNPRRTTATASALMIGLALVTTMTIAGASASASVDDAVRKNVLGDLVVSNAIGQGFSPSIGAEISRLPGVAKISRLRFAVGKVDGKQHFMGAVDPRSLSGVIRLDVKSGRIGHLRDGTAFVSRTVARRDHLHVGSKLAWTFPQGSRTLRVVGTYDADSGVGAGYLTTLGTLTTAGFKPLDNTVFVTLHAGADVHQVQRAIDRRLEPLPTVTVKNQRQFAAEQRKPIDQLVTMVYALLGLALVIAVLGVVNTLGLSVVERTREIGLLRAIGLGRGQVRSMIGLESVVISILGAALGIALGLVFGVALTAVLRDQGLTVTRVPWVSLLGYLVAAGLVGVLAALLPARRAARIDVLRAIATE